MTGEPKLTVYWNEDCFGYRPPDGAFYAPSHELLAVDEPHPDSPNRIRNIKHAIEEGLGDRATSTEATPATADDLTRVHDGSYVEEVRAFAEADGGRLIPSTWMDEATFDAALAAVGSATEAVEGALRGENVAYALCRPSGHHAQPAQVDGHCVFNNVAIAVEAALSAGLADRAAVVDWDVHHGNGTQEIFYDRDDVLVVDIHNDHGSWHPETHPQTGGTGEVGAGAGEGYNVNVTVPPGTGDEGYAWVFEHIVEPVVAAFGPDLLAICAGQDPGQLDPQGRNLVTTDGFYNLGRRARTLSDVHAGGNLAVVQEGGYQLSHLGLATLSALEGTLGVEPTLESDPLAWMPEDFDAIEPRLRAVASEHTDRWPVSV